MTTTPTRQDSVHAAKILFAVAALLGVLQAYAARWAVTLDSVSYFDVARAYVRHDWPVAVNLYWSPAFSWIMAVAFALFKPSLHSEFPIARAAQCVIYLFTLVAFRQCWNALAQLRDHLSATSPDQRIAGLPWEVAGYALFVAMMVPASGFMTPDLLTGAFVFVATAILAKIALGEVSADKFAQLGAALGASYYCKAAMLPVGLAMLVVLAFWAWKSRTLRNFLAAPLALALTVAPWVAVLSHSAGHLTSGGVGRIAYKEYVNSVQRLRSFDWLSMDNSDEEPAGAKVIFDAPRVYRTDVIPRVTDPLVYDHARLELAPMQFSLHNQLIAIGLNLKFYRFWFALLQGGFVALVAWQLCLHFRATIRAIGQHVEMFALPVAALGLYALVYTEGRYIAPFCVVLWGTWMAVTPWRTTERRAAHAAVIAATILLAVMCLPLITESTVHRSDDASRFVRLAEIMRQQGIREGTKVAIFGREEQIWLHLLGASSVAQIRNREDFEQASPEQRAAAINAVRLAGAQFLVGPATARSTADKVPGTSYTCTNLQQ